MICQFGFSIFAASLHSNISGSCILLLLPSVLRAYMGFLVLFTLGELLIFATQVIYLLSKDIVSIAYFLFSIGIFYSLLLGLVQANLMVSFDEVQQKSVLARVEKSYMGLPLTNCYILLIEPKSLQNQWESYVSIIAGSCQLYMSPLRSTEYETTFYGHVYSRHSHLWRCAFCSTCWGSPGLHSYPPQLAYYNLCCGLLNHY